MRWLPSSLGGRFALAAAGLAAGALVLVSAASWWLIDRQHDQAIEQLAAREREFHAAAVGSQLQALAGRMREVAGSTILATGLVDSAGRETYLAPFLAGIRQVNGVPVQVLFTDFEGHEIESNGTTRFTPAELQWLRRALAAGEPAATLFPGDNGHELVALEPLTYARTASPEGGLFYKVALADVHIGEGMRLEWGAAPPAGGAVAPVPVPPVFEPLGLRVSSVQAPALAGFSIPTGYAAPMIGFAVLLFAAVSIAGVWLARLLTRDVQALEAFSSRVVASGLSAERAPVAGSAEVASLALSVNRMLDALHAADQRKDEFLAILAHELRNPLSPIANSLELLKRVGGDSEHAAQARAAMERQVRHLVRLVDDLLDVSRITRGRLELRKERVRLSSIIEQALESCRAQIDAAGHQLVVDRLPEALWVDADPVRLVQVLSNLLNNAARYTPRGGRIALDVARAGSQVEVRLRDNGEGIAPDMIDRVFEMFTRAQPGRGQGGLGIGLTLARRLVELHGGSIQAFSAGPGRGAEFAVRLPLAAGAALPVPAAAPVPGLLARRVLVVDDNRDAAATLAALLAHGGCDVRIAHSGEEALQALTAQRPEAVLLDIGLPGLDGYQVCRAIRSQPGGRELLVVALTGWGQAQDRQRSEQAGFDAHLVKPADYDALARILSRRAALAAARAPARDAA